MSNITITNNDLGNVILEGADFRDELIKFLGLDTFVAGTILARQEVVLAVANGVDTGTGDGTATVITVVPGTVVPIAGAYVLTCTTAVATGGIFQLTDPNGAIIASDLIMALATPTTFEAGGLSMLLTVGAADWIVGDIFTITVVADGDLVPFVVAGAGGAQIPLAILTFDISVTGAEDVSSRVAVVGKFRKERLVIDADGDASNVDNAVIDALRVHGLTPIDVQELNILDNQ